MRSLQSRRVTYHMLSTTWIIQIGLMSRGQVARPLEGFEWRLGRETVIHPLPPRR